MDCINNSIRSVTKVRNFPLFCGNLKLKKKKMRWMHQRCRAYSTKTLLTNNPFQWITSHYHWWYNFCEWNTEKTSKNSSRTTTEHDHTMNGTMMVRNTIMILFNSSYRGTVMMHKTLAALKRENVRCKNYFSNVYTLSTLWIADYWKCMCLKMALIKRSRYVVLTDWPICYLQQKQICLQL